MTEGRLYWPNEQDAAIRAAVATIPGARWLSTKEDKPLKLNEITPHKLALHLRENGIDVPRISWQSIFSTLRSFPLGAQEAALFDFYSGKVAAFPNPEGLAKAAAAINSISWFTPTEEPDPVKIQEIIDRYKTGLGQKSIRVRLIRDWKTVWDDRLPYEIPEDAEREYSSRDDVSFSVKAVAMGIADSARANIEKNIVETRANLSREQRTRLSRRITMRIEKLTRRDLKWQIENPGKENPYHVLMEIYLEGGWAIGERNGEYLVFFSSQSQPAML